MSTKRVSKSERVSTGKAVVKPKLPTIAPQPRIHSLASLVRDDNPEYGTMIGYIRAGATPVAAAASIRLSPKTIKEWWSKYQEGSDNHQINRLGRDIEEAIGQASVVAEASVYDGDKGRWLKTGPRKLLSNCWEDKDTNAVPSTPSNPTVNNTLIIGGDLQRDALAALEAAGIIQVRRTNEPLTVSALPAK